MSSQKKIQRNYKEYKRKRFYKHVRLEEIICLTVKGTM